MSGVRISAPIVLVHVRDMTEQAKPVKLIGTLCLLFYKSPINLDVLTGNLICSIQGAILL
jgi:hypothetical protein